MLYTDHSHSGEDPTLIKQFALFLKGGILRCRGRLNNSTNISLKCQESNSLTTQSPVCELADQQYHKRSKHSGVNDTLTLLRENYWILKGKQIVKQIISKCVMCLKCDYHVTTTPDLLVEQVSDDLPFTHVGIDFTGPLYIKDKYLNQSKVYACLFTY